MAFHHPGCAEEFPVPVLRCGWRRWWFGRGDTVRWGRRPSSANAPRDDCPSAVVRRGPASAIGRPTPRAAPGRRVSVPVPPRRQRSTATAAGPGPGRAAQSCRTPVPALPGKQYLRAVVVPGPQPGCCRVLADVSPPGCSTAAAPLPGARPGWDLNRPAGPGRNRGAAGPLPAVRGAGRWNTGGFERPLDASGTSYRRMAGLEVLDSDLFMPPAEELDKAIRALRKVYVPTREEADPRRCAVRR